MELKIESAFANRTLRDYVRVLFSRWPVIITSIVGVTGIAFIALMLHTPYYSAQVKMLISAQKQVESPYYRDLAGYSSEKIAVTESEIVKASPVLERTVEALGLYQLPFDYEKNFASPMKKKIIEWQNRNGSPFDQLPADRKRGVLFRLAVDRLKQSIDVEPIRDTNTFVITVNDFSPIGAATIANTISRSYIVFDLEQQLAEVQMKYGGLHPTVVQLRDNINKMLKTLGGTPIANSDAIGPGRVKIIEQASIALKPEGASRKQLFVIAFALSIVLGIILAFTFEFFDPTFKTPLETEEVLQLPLLGSLPKNGKYGDTFKRNLAEQVYFLMKDRNLKCILLAPVENGTQSKSVAGELASYLADKAGRKVLLIDADFNHPTLHQYFKLPASPGLGELLEGKAGFAQAVKSVSDKLSVLPAGKTSQNALLLLDSDDMREILKLAKEKFPLVFINASALATAKEALLISPSTDGALVMVDEGTTRKEVARAAVASLEKANAPVIGTILRNRTFPIPKIIYERV